VEPRLFLLLGHEAVVVVPLLHVCFLLFFVLRVFQLSVGDAEPGEVLDSVQIITACMLVFDQGIHESGIVPVLGDESVAILWETQVVRVLISDLFCAINPLDRFEMGVLRVTCPFKRILVNRLDSVKRLFLPVVLPGHCTFELR